jgi:hypothetical protein
LRRRLARANRRLFAVLPQVAMSHHTRRPLFELSMNSHPQ